MAMSDCEKCWETPCACGHDYRGYSKNKLMDVYNAIRKVVKERYPEVIEAEKTEVK